jgi:amino acid permease
VESDVPYGSGLLFYQGYQPGIAFLAAGALSPLATLILVLVTLFAAYPVYSRVAEQSPNGQGSISMLERLFPNWTGKMSVLCLLGFAATDFIITITLSAADGTAHLIRNPFIPPWLHHQEALTLLLLVLLGTIFLKGFKEAIGIAVFLVAIYLALNLAVVSVAVAEVLKHPQTIAGWKQQLWHQHGGSVGLMLAVSLGPTARRVEIVPDLGG